MSDRLYGTTIIYITIAIYLCSSILPYRVHAQTWSSLTQEANEANKQYIKDSNARLTAFPDTTISSTNDITHIVSLFVDVAIYGSIKSQLEWYTTEYIQKKLPRSKVLVIPLSTAVAPQDIALINDNLYHDGIKGKSSRLVGTIIVGPFDLPSVWNQDKSTKSVYPWVDFEDLQFAWNASGQRFEYTENANGQAEIWHGIIDFQDNVQEYRDFFERLQVYHANPLAYTSRRIWLDDFVKLKKSYDSSKLLGYINNFLYAEDKSYHRFTPIFASLLQTGQSVYDSQVTKDYTDKPTFDLSRLSQSDALGKLYQYNFKFLPGMSWASGAQYRQHPPMPELVGTVDPEASDYADQFNQENDRIKQIIRDSKEHNEEVLGSPEETMFRNNMIPTKFLGVSALKYFHPYRSLFSDTYINNIYANTDAGGRYLNSKLGAGEVDNHMRYVGLKDDLSIQTIRDLNDILEQALDRKIEKEKYMMNIPLLDTIKVYKKCPLKKCLDAPKLIRENLLRGYEQFFFGRNAMDIIQASELTIFRGSFANIKTLDDALEVPLGGQVLGGSYGKLTSTETICHAGYHFQEDIIESDREEAKLCGKKKKKVKRYMYYVWGNMTPLNIDPDATDSIRLIEPLIDPMLARNPSFNKKMGRPSFDLAGCVASSGDMILGATDSFHDGYDGEAPRLPFSYSGYSDTYVGIDYFGSLARVETSTLCALGSVNVCKPWQKSVHKDDMDYLYSSNFFTLIEDIIPLAKDKANADGFRVHAKKGFKTEFLEGGFFYHTPIVENNQPVYVGAITGGTLLGVLNFAKMPSDYTGDTYPSDTPHFILSEDISPDTTLGSNPYTTLMDGHRCTNTPSYKKLFQHFYKTIDSRIYHKSPTEGELQSMSTSTLARPIDDPRYISFKGISGSKISFPYPNLYDTPLGGDVSVDGIKASIISYLQQKANEQREVLIAELEGSQAQYENHKKAYDLLSNVDTIATPLLSSDRPYKVFDSDFYVRALGSTGLIMAAENIYYQLRNRPGYSNQTFATVGDQIDWMKKNFNINKKIEYIMGAYLTHDPQENKPGINKIRKNMIGINDGYRQQGYEIAVINSDSDDYLLTANPLESQYPKGVNREIQNSQDGSAGDPRTILDINNAGGTGFATGSYIISGENVAHDVLCGDQQYGSVVSLLKWPKALKCWLEQTLKSPITLTINFKSARGPVISDEIIKYYTKDTRVGDYSQTTDKFSKLTSGDWMEINNPWKQYVGKEHENQDQLLQSDGVGKPFGLFVINDVVLTNDNPIIDLTAGSGSILNASGVTGQHTYSLHLGARDTSVYNTVQIRIYSTGDNCIKVFDQETCETYIFQAPLNKPLQIPFVLGSKKVGNTIVDIGICLNDQTCYYKTTALEITSSIVDHVVFHTPAQILTRGYQTPLVVIAYDQYNNRVYRTSDEFKLKVTGGHILQGKQVFNNFNDALYLFIPEKPSIGFTLEKSEYDVLQHYSNTTPKYQHIASASVQSLPPHMRVAWAPISINRLGSIPGNEYKYLIIKGIPWALLEVESVNGLWEPGIFKVSTGVTSSSFVPNKDFEIKNTLTIPLRPTYKAGKDQIKIRIVYTEDRVVESTVNVNVKPGFPYKIHLNKDHVVVPWGSSVTGEVVITDMYNNISDMPVTVFSTTQMPLCIPGKCQEALEQDGISFGTGIITGTGTIQFDTYRGAKEGVGGQGIAQLKMLGFPSQINIIPGLGTGISELVGLNSDPQGGEQTNTSLTVEYKGMSSRTVWPIKNINVMYLTLMGSGWSKYQYDLFTQSNKLLSLTTVLGTTDIITNTYKSLQDSNDTSLDIGFREPFRHITEFSEGHIVGESTKGFGSYRLVNYGDPVLTRIDKNRFIQETAYDGGIGKYIHSYPDQTIRQTDEIDFDGDGMKDILVTMVDGVVRLLKNYLKHPTPGVPAQYHDIGMIGRIGDGIIDVKTNPDGLFLRSQNGKMRRYALGGGKMAIDGDLICLDMPGGPEFSSLYRVPQVHFVDFDLDGYTDILTADYMGRIIVTYGHTTPNPLDTPVKDIAPFVGPFPLTGQVLRTMISKNNILWSGTTTGSKPYKYEIQISDPDPLKYQHTHKVYLKDLGSLHQPGLKYIIDISAAGWKSSVRSMSGSYFADTFDQIQGVQAIFEDMPYSPNIGLGHSYLSSSQFMCDRWWKYRQYQDKNRIVLEEATIIITGGNDQSLVAGQSHGNESSLTAYTQNPQKELDTVDVSMYQSKYASVMNYGQQTGEDSFFVPKLQDTYVPVIEGPKTQQGYRILSPILGDSNYYCPISICPRGITKTLSGSSKPGDYVTVRVDFSEDIGRYIENIQGPRKILKQSDGKPLHYSSSQKPGTMIPYFEDLPGGYVMYLDNIKAGDWFSYTIQYLGADIYTLLPEYLNCDAYPDVKVAGKNGCNKNMNYYLNLGDKRNKKSLDLAKFIIDEQEKENIISNQLLSDTYKQVASATKQGDTTSDMMSNYNFAEPLHTPFTMIDKAYESHPIDGNIPIYREESHSSMGGKDIGYHSSPIHPITTSSAQNIVFGDSLLSVGVRFLTIGGVSKVYAQDNNTSQLQNTFVATRRFIDTANQRSNYGNPTINLDLSKSTSQKLQKGLDKVLNDLCHGLQVAPGGKCPKPFQMPFNMAFLAPGTYNLMGKKLMEDKGLPAFFFPGTLYAPGPIPIPYGLKSSSDEFYRADGGNPTFPSMIRLYIAPTLTLGLGFGICFGTDKPLRSGLKKPFKDIVGNCIAIATDLKPQCSAQGNAGGSPSLDDSQGAASYPISYTRPSNYVLSTRFLDLLLCPVCMIGSAQEKLILHTQSSAGDYVQQNSHITEHMDDNDQRSGSNTLPGGMVNGVVSVQDVIESTFITVEKTKEFMNSIKGGASVGIMPAIQRWIEQQIEYIINNAFHLDIKIYTPDLGALTKGFKEVGDIGDIYKSKSVAGSSIGKDNGLGFNRPAGAKLTSQLSTVSSNPFDTLAQAFEHVSLFKFTQKDIQIKLPMIYSEDISRYTAYLKGWLHNQQSIAQQWKDALESCKSGKGLQKLQNCDFLEFRANQIQSSVTQFERSIRKNISTLEYYRNLPSQLTQYLNVHERYLAEVTETYAGLVATVSRRMQENSLRFEKRVESLILLVGIIKTWQIIPDFSINRTEKCSKCTVDTYSYLSEDRGSLTPSLPILPIPPFSIPDIILDLSKINVGLTITLPHFTIVPTRVPLPKLPNIPSPFVVDLSMPDIALHIPEIPLLPQLQLPPFELPSFMPQVELKLPMLPPAVKIPKINPGIRTIMKLIEFLGNLVCIYKRGFGLVGENSLKTKIEQMTQRTADLFPFDALINLEPMSPLKGYDIRVDTFVNFAFNFEGVYDVFKSMADTLNKVSNTFTSTLTRSKDIINQGSNTYINTIQDFSNNLQFNYDYKLEDYKIVKNEFLSDLNQLPLLALPSSVKQKLSAVQTLVQGDADITLNTGEFEKIAHQGKQILISKQQELAHLKHALQQNYQQFVEDTPRYQFVSDADVQHLNFKLFRSNPDTIQTLKDMQDPDKIFLDINQVYIKSLLHLTDTVQAAQLGRDTNTHVRARKLLQDLDQSINRAHKNFRDPTGKHISPILLAQISQNNVQQSPVSPSTQSQTIGNTQDDAELEESGSDDDSSLPSQVGDEQDIESPEQLLSLNKGTLPPAFVPASAEGASESGNYTDPTNQIQGYFAPPGPLCKDDPYFGTCAPDNVCTDETYNIIDWPGKNLELYKSQSHKLAQPSSPLVLHEEKTVFMKTAGEGRENDIYFKDFYELPSASSLKDLAQSTKEGYILVKGEWYKVRDHYFHMHDFVAKGQNYENISFQWKSIYASGYILRVSNRVDVFPDKLGDNKAAPGSYGSTPKIIKYILMLPFGTDLDSLRISVKGEFESESIQSLKEKKLLLAINYFRPQDQTITVMLENLPSQRYYTQIRPLHLQDRGLIASILSSVTQTVSLGTTAPWSTQQMGGMQLVSDNEPPTGLFNLVRKATGLIEGTGQMLDGVIMTHYKITATRDDNSKVMYSWINHKGKLLKKVPGNRVDIDDLYFTGGFNEVYEFGAMDSAGMTTVEQVVMDVTIPDIQIVDIKSYDQKYAHVVAEISRDMDEGTVKFDRLRNVFWKSLKDIDGHDMYTLVPGQTIVTGGLYDLQKSYDLKDNKGHTILSLDPQHPNIIIPPDQKSKYRVDTSLQQGRIALNIVDKKTNQTLFTYYPVSQQASPYQSLQINNAQYKSIALNNTSNPDLNGGTCIAKIGGECEILIDKQGNPLIPSPYSQTLSASYTPKNAGTATYQFQDSNANPIASVSVVLKPLN